MNRQKDGSGQELRLGGDGREIKAPYVPEACALEGKGVNGLPTRCQQVYHLLCWMSTNFTSERIICRRGVI